MYLARTQGKVVRMACLRIFAKQVTSYEFQKKNFIIEHGHCLSYISKPGMVCLIVDDSATWEWFYRARKVCTFLYEL